LSKWEGHRGEQDEGLRVVTEMGLPRRHDPQSVGPGDPAGASAGQSGGDQDGGDAVVGGPGR